MVDRDDKVDSFGRTFLQPSTSDRWSTEIQKFREIFMPRACEKYKFVKRNMGIDTLEFLIDDIRRPFNHDRPEKGGFNIVAWPNQYIENTLLPLLIDEGLIESISPRRYRLRESGKRYCRRLDPSIQHRMIGLRHWQFVQGDSFPETGTVLSPSRKWETQNTLLMIITLMTFKVIITRPNVEDDENAYHGIVFLNPNKVQTKRLKYVAPEDKLKATFTFEGNPIKVGDKFLACLVAVDGGVEIENATFKIQKNSPQNKPEVVNFQHNLPNRMRNRRRLNRSLGRNLDISSKIQATETLLLSLSNNNKQKSR